MVRTWKARAHQSTKITLLGTICLSLLIPIATATTKTTPETTATTLSLYLDSLLIILREGFESILVISAILTYLSKTHKTDLNKNVYTGIISALILTILLYIAASTAIEISEVNQEVLEGVTLIIAAIVLFNVSYWLISKAQTKKWQQYIAGTMSDAVTQRNGNTLTLLSFLVVFREGFETVLFYKALTLSSRNLVFGELYLVAGFITGIILLTGIYIGFTKFSLQIPTKQFFTGTAILLFIMAFKFIGKGLHELQEAGILTETTTSLTVPSTIQTVFGVYPYAEIMAIQGLMLFSVLLGAGYTFILKTARQST